MTISSTIRTAGPYPGTGVSTGPFPFAFKIFQPSDLLVLAVNTTTNLPTTLALTTDYTVSMNADQDNNPGGYVTLVAALTITQTLTITSNVPLTQGQSIPNAGPFQPKVVENALDKLTILLQQVGGVDTSRTLRVPEANGVPLLPDAATRANTQLLFDGQGQPLLAAPVSGTAADLLLQLVAATLTLKLATMESGGGGGTAYSQASYLSRKNITLHAWYDFLSNSTHAYNAGQPTIGHASFNDNNTIAGTVASDHHHSFQSDFHYACSATIGVASSFWSQADITAGTITELSGLKVNNPTGVGGAVGTHYGVLIGTLTRGATNNWGLYSSTKSFVGGQFWLGNASGPQGLIEYNPNLGHIQVQPRAGFCFKVGGAAGDRKIRLGDPTDDSADATIENASDGRFTLTPRTGFGLFLNGTVEAGAVIASGPVVTPGYTVATLPSAVTYVKGRAYVTDATTTTFAATVVGGGTNKVPVFSDGSVWRIG